MKRRLLTVLALAAGAAALSGCVVVPTEPAYGYGHGPAVRVVPPPVVVVPPPRHRYYYSRDYDGRGYDGRGYDPRWH